MSYFYINICITLHCLMYFPLLFFKTKRNSKTTPSPSRKKKNIWTKWLMTQNVKWYINKLYWVLNLNGRKYSWCMCLKEAYTPSSNSEKTLLRQSVFSIRILLITILLKSLELLKAVHIAEGRSIHLVIVLKPLCTCSSPGHEQERRSAR